MREVLTTRAGCRGRDRSRLPGRDPGQDLQAPAPSRPPTSGPAPVTRRSGSSIRGERVCRTGNKRLKHAMFLSAFASLTDPVSRTYYQRKRDQGKRLGPGPARPGPPPHPHPARHDPRRSPLRPATSHETTRSRLTHHIGAPPPTRPEATARSPPRSSTRRPPPHPEATRADRHQRPSRPTSSKPPLNNLPGTHRGGVVSESVAKAPRAGIGREKKRGISTILLRCSGAIRAFATDLDNGAPLAPPRRAPPDQFAPRRPRRAPPRHRPQSPTGPAPHRKTRPRLRSGWRSGRIHDTLIINV